MVEAEVLAILAETEVPVTTDAPWPHANQLAEKERESDDLMEAYSAKQLTKERVFPRVAKLNGEIRTLKRERSAWNREQQRASKASASVVKEWPDLDTDRRRAVMETVIHTVAIGPRTIKQARFDPARVEIVRHERSMAEVIASLSVLLRTAA